MTATDDSTPPSGSGPRHMFRLLPESRDLIDNALFLTSAMRSGTTMMQRLLDSLDQMEMFKDPPLLYGMMPTIHALPEEHWRYIFEVCLFEDYFIPSLTGLRVNANRQHRSYIGLSKPPEELERRLNQPPSHPDAVASVGIYRMGFKITEMLPYVERLQSYYPQMEIMIMVRNPVNVMASIMKEGYYSDDQIFGVSKKWPLKATRKANIPFWVPEDEHDRFIAANEVERCCLSYIYQYDSLNRDCRYWVLSYDDLVEAPKARFANLAEMKGWRYGPLTDGLIAGIREPDRYRKASQPADEIDPGLRRRMLDLYDEFRAEAVRL